jgi:DNA-binding SARP family transcriptional activator
VDDDADGRRAADDPGAEDAARERMRELAAAGDYAGALSEYVRLEAELPVPPSRETRRLLEEIRRQAPPPLGTSGYPL